jgi:hypothetical protein
LAEICTITGDRCACAALSTASIKKVFLAEKEPTP